MGNYYFETALPFFDYYDSMLEDFKKNALNLYEELIYMQVYKPETRLLQDIY